MLGDLLSRVFRPPSSDQIRVLRCLCDRSSRPWSLFITFYVILILAAAGLPFILGRVINISTRLEHQLETYTETTIWGDLSESDAKVTLNQYSSLAASLALFLGINLDNLTSKDTGFYRYLDIRWVDGSIFVASRRTIELQWRQRVLRGIVTVPAQARWERFGVVSLEQNGFRCGQTDYSVDGGSVGRIAAEVRGPRVMRNMRLMFGPMHDRTPRWGIRIHCEKLPEPEKYL